jgi:hypothetical protein
VRVPLAAAVGHRCVATTSGTRRLRLLWSGGVGGCIPGGSDQLVAAPAPPMNTRSELPDVGVTEGEVTLVLGTEFN